MLIGINLVYMLAKIPYFKKRFFEGLEGSHLKKAFLKWHQAISNSNIERSKLHMTNLSILFGLYIIRAVDW